MAQHVLTLENHRPGPHETVAARRPRQSASPAKLRGDDIAKPTNGKPAQANPTTAGQIDIDVVQLERLAHAILSKDHHDLAALAATNPVLMEEWQRAFRAQHAEAVRSAQYWASAAAVLATVKGLGAPVAAE